MKTPTITHEQLAIVAGGAIIAAATNAIIQKTGGLWTSHALLVIGLAFGVFTASYVLPRAWRDTRAISIVIICALTAGEIYNFATTAERIVVAREEAQAPARDQDERRAALNAKASELAAAKPTSERLALAKQRLADLATSTTDTPRVRVAREHAAEAQAAVDVEAGNVSCKSECQRKQRVADKAAADLHSALNADAAERRALLEKAEAEVASALREAVEQHAKAAATAKAEADAVPPSVSATPLADRTGIAPWALDLVLAALLSLGANGLAAALISYGAAVSANAKTFSEIKAEALSAIEPSPLTALFSGEQPEPTPTPPRGSRKTKKASPANVLQFPAKHPVVQALEKAGGSVASNHDLAKLMNVTDGEASKRVQEIQHLLTVEKIGKQLRISLRKSA